MTYNKLTPEEERVIVDKGTEMPGTGEYNDFFVEGTYTCRRCSAPLYESTAKFHSGCGWPSFDQEIVGAVKHVLDTDGRKLFAPLVRLTWGTYLPANGLRPRILGIASIQFLLNLFQKTLYIC